MRNGIAVVGPGNWGSSLIAALRASGLPVTEVVGRERSRGVVGLEYAELSAPMLWLCVPDAAIADCAAVIARRRRNLRGQLVLHSSGALTVDALAAAGAAGASLASVHPAMSFPSHRPVPLKGVFFGVEATAEERRLFRLVRRLGGRPFAVASEKKAAYHAAATLASPLLASLLAAAESLARAAGLESEDAHEWVAALAGATAANSFARGPAQSFSGPFARGDADTISLHLRTLRGHPMLRDVYRALAVYAVKSLPAREPQDLMKVLRMRD